MEDVDTSSQSRNQQDILKEEIVKNEVENRSREIEKCIRLIKLSLFSIILPIFLFFYFLKYSEDQNEMFARSGCILVLCALWIEIGLFKIESLKNIVSHKDGFTYTDIQVTGNLHGKFAKKIKQCRYIAVVLAVCGTIIWGYGDLIWKFFH